MTLETLLNKMDQTIIELARRQRSGRKPLYPHAQQRCFGFIIRNCQIPSIQRQKFDEGDSCCSLVAVGKRVVVRKCCAPVNTPRQRVIYTFILKKICGSPQSAVNQALVTNARQATETCDLTIMNMPDVLKRQPDKLSGQDILGYSRSAR